MQNDMRDRLIELHKKAHNEWLRKEYDHETDKSIAEYVVDEFLANGVIVPPVKVGDTVYAVKGCFYLPYAYLIKPSEFIRAEVIAIKQTKTRKILLLKPLIKNCHCTRISNKWFPFSAFGKTVFLTREEAEEETGVKGA